METRRTGNDRRNEHDPVSIEKRDGRDRRKVCVRTGQYINILQKIPIFRGLSAEQSKKILSIATHKTFQEGEPLCHIGDKSHEIFILIKGQLLVSSPAGKEITRIDPIGTIGEMGIFTDELRSANVCAAMESITIIIRKTEFIILLRRDNDLAIHILMNVIKDLSEKLRKDNKIIEDLKESDHTVKEPDHPGQHPDHTIQQPDHTVQQPDHTVQQSDHTLQQTPHSGQRSDNTGEQG